MKIAYAYGSIPAEDYEQVRDVLYDNLMIAFLITLEFIHEHGLQYDRPETNAAAVAFRENRVLGTLYWQFDYNLSLEKMFLPWMERLWWDKTFQQALERGNEYAQLENVHYCFEHRKRLFQQTDLRPNDEDFLHARVRTDGITRECFAANNFLYEVFDMDGCRSGRRQWIHTFDGVDCVFFVASLSGYDRILVEDATTNQLTESLLLFEAIVSSVWSKSRTPQLRNSSIVLILNKLDIFKRKIQKNQNPLKDYYPDYVGREKDYEAALTYIVAKFKAQQRLDDERKLHIYFSDATDIKGCQAMLQDIEENVMLKASVGQKIAEDAMIGVAI
ncbi:MAG: hypothetical protein Q9224_004790 [Gallowayella concinna]